MRIYADLRHAAVAADPRRTVGESQVTGPLVSFVPTAVSSLFFSSSPAGADADAVRVVVG